MQRSTAELTAIARRHGEAEGAGDLEGTLATLEAQPRYELFPVGLTMSGADRTRRYYEHFFAEVAPRIVGAELIDEWGNERGLMQEYSVQYRYDDGRQRVFRIAGLLVFGSTALAGERLFADEEFLRILFGPVWVELEPV